MGTGSNSKPATRRGRGRPSLEDTADIENKVLRVALEEFIEHGYGGASITQMVKKAGMSKTTVYSRFSSKQELFSAIMTRQIEQVSPASLLQPLDGKLNLEHGLKTYANHSLKLSLESENMAVNRLMYSESYRFPELGEAAAERTRLGIRRIAAFIGECAAADAIPCGDPEAIAEVFILMNRGWYIDIMLTNRRTTTRDRENWVNRAVHSLLSSRDQW